MKRVATTLIITCITLLSFARQNVEDPAVILSNAQATFDDGKIRNVKNVLEDLLRKSELKQVDLLKAQKTDAMRLLTIAHLYLEDEQSADDTMLELLGHNHEFEFNDATDPTKFINLYKTYRTDPVYNITGSFGLHYLPPGVASTQLQGGINPQVEYSFIPKISASLGWQKQITDKLIIHPEVKFRTNTVSVEEISDFVSGPSSELSENKNEYVENQTWLEIPLGVQYRITNFVLRPYLSGGIAPRILVNFDLPSDQNNKTVDGVIEPGKIPSKSDKEGQRNKLMIAPFLGAGIQYKLGEGYLTLEARYSYDLLKVSDSNLVPFENLTPYNYRLSGTELTIGYTKNIYSPEKLNH